MRNGRTSIPFAAACLAVALSACSGGPSKALDSIRAQDMKFSQRFLGSAEFQGRSTPSAELDIASEYIALTAARIGLKPLLLGGSYYQDVPVDVTTVVPGASRLRLSAAGRERTFAFPAVVGKN